MSDRPTVRDVLAAWGVLLNDRQALQLLDEMNEAVKEHEIPSCSICGEYARYRMAWLLPHARTNPASSGYRGDDISRCSDRSVYRCEHHKSYRQFPVDGFEWCSTLDLEWKANEDADG